MSEQMIPIPQVGIGETMLDYQGVERLIIAKEGDREWPFYVRPTARHGTGPIATLAVITPELAHYVHLQSIAWIHGQTGLTDGRIVAIRVLCGSYGSPAAPRNEPVQTPIEKKKGKRNRLADLFSARLDTIERALEAIMDVLGGEGRDLSS